MASVSEKSTTQQSRKMKTREYPSLSSKFEWLYTITTTWFIIGAHIDGWSHNNTPELESFFTPSHAVLYTGMFAVSALMVYYAVINYMSGHSLLRSLPQGYPAVLFGSFVFALGGIGDGFWHTFLGIEVNVEALYSPTHLMLAIGAALMVSGGLRRMWLVPDEFLNKTFKEKIPSLLSTAFFMSIITFFFQYAVPFHSISPMSANVFGPEAGPIGSQGLGITGTIIYTVLLNGVIIKSYQKFGEDLPKGTFTLILPVNVLFSTMMRFAIPELSNLEYISTEGNLTRVGFVIIALLMGYLIDLGINYLSKSGKKERDLTIFAIAIPVIFFSLYIITIAVTTGLGWSIHLATGLPVVAGITGYLTRLLLIQY